MPHGARLRVGKLHEERRGARHDLAEHELGQALARGRDRLLAHHHRLDLAHEHWARARVSERARARKRSVRCVSGLSERGGLAVRPVHHTTCEPRATTHANALCGPLLAGHTVTRQPFASLASLAADSDVIDWARVARGDASLAAPEPATECVACAPPPPPGAAAAMDGARPSSTGRDASVIACAHSGTSRSDAQRRCHTRSPVWMWNVRAVSWRQRGARRDAVSDERARGTHEAGEAV